MTAERSVEKSGPMVGIDLIDYRELPGGSLDNAMNIAQTSFTLATGKEMTANQKLTLRQGFAMCVFLSDIDYGTRNPFEIDRDSKSLRPDVKKLVRYRDMYFTEDNVGNPALYASYVAVLGPIAIQDVQLLRGEDYKARNKRPYGEEMEGDPDLTDPKRGTAGITSGALSPEDPRISGDNQSLHHGPGYDA